MEVLLIISALLLVAATNKPDRGRTYVGNPPQSPYAPQGQSLPLKELPHP